MTKTQTVKAECNQHLSIENRNILSLNGVNDVISFDESSALLNTVFGMLVLDGEELHVTKLDIDGGSMIIEGKINGLFFSDSKGKGRKKLFR